MNKGLAETEAICRIEAEFVGEKIQPRGGGRGLYASPKAIAMLDLRPAVSKAPKTWRSPRQLVHRGEESRSGRVTAEKLKNLRDELVRDIVDSGIPEDDAGDLVDHHLIGRRRTGLGSQETLFASPDALRILGDGSQAKNARNPKRSR